MRAVRRKVNEVMQSINEFIMGMINQALGLDEIEAELDGGGQDIDARGSSLDETDTGLDVVGEQAVAEEERNRQSMAQAEANIDDSRATREDALALQGDLAAHDSVLQAEEMAGQTYIVDFAATQRPYFEAMREGGGAGEPSEGLEGEEEVDADPGPELAAGSEAGAGVAAMEEEESDESTFA